MASELRVDTLKDASGNNSIGLSYVAEGSAKAWINFNGTGTVASRDTFNITSLADVATGKYSFNIINDMNNNDYAISGGGRTPSVTSGDINAPSDADSDQAPGSLEFYSIQGSSGNATDLSHIYVIIHGDLA